MPKRIIQQARGKGSTTYKAPSFKYKGASKHLGIDRSLNGPVKGTVIDIIHCRGHSAPLIKVSFENNENGLIVAPENIKIGDNIVYGTQEVQNGNCLKLKDLTEGTIIYNIESNPGDGGKLVRAGGAFARVLANLKDHVVVMLPSKKQKSFSPECRASIGVVAGSGRLEKPLLKAGKKYFKMKAKNKLWPSTSACAMNAVDHPYGGTSSSRKGRPTIAPRFAPPGRNVGMLRPAKTGRAKAKRIRG